MRRLTEAQRAERREADRERSMQAVEALRTSDGWQAWLDSRRHFHSYSLRNQLLIAMQCPHATRVAGFRAWLKLGYCVRRGEHAIRIWQPVPPSAKAIEQWRAAGADPEHRPRTFFKLGPVFDRSQVDELPPPAVVVAVDCPIVPLLGDELAWCIAPLVALAESIGSTVTFEPLPPDVGGSCRVDTLAIAINSDRSPNAQVHALCHETGHALVRAEPADDDPPLSYAEEELVVESITYTVCGALGLDTSGYAIPYLTSWSQDTPVETIHACAAIIDRHARRIETAVLPSDPAAEADENAADTQAVAA